AAIAPGDLEVLHLRRCAAEHYLRSGYLDEGVNVIRGVLSSVGLRYPVTPRRALFSLIVNRFRLGLRNPRTRSKRGLPLRPPAPASFDACWSAGLGLSLVDSIRAFTFQVRHALLVFPGGDAADGARALTTEALIMVLEGGERKRRRSLRLQIEGERLAAASGDVRVQVHAQLMAAASAFLDRRARDVLAACERGEALCRERCLGAVWEQVNLQLLAAHTLALLGEFSTLRARLEEIMQHARERGDQYALTNFRLGHVNL